MLCAVSNKYKTRFWARKLTLLDHYFSITRFINADQQKNETVDRKLNWSYLKINLDKFYSPKFRGGKS